MKLYIDGLIKAVDALERAVIVSDTDLPETVEEVVRAGVIQTFEVAYDQGWKLMKKYLEDDLGSHYVDGIARRELFRLAAEHHLIVDAVKWMKFHEARNKTSHTYNSATAHDVFDVAKEFAEEGRLLIKVLGEKCR